MRIESYAARGIREVHAGSLGLGFAVQALVMASFPVLDIPHEDRVRDMDLAELAATVAV
jgi:hypothetical protein